MRYIFHICLSQDEKEFISHRIQIPRNWRCVLMIFPLVYIRDDVDNSDSTKLEDEKISSSLHAQTAFPVSSTTIAEDATVEATKESENQGTGQAE